MVSERALAYFEKVKQAPVKRRNVLLPFKDDIVFLKSKGLTVKEIHTYLVDELGVSVSFSTVDLFLRKLNQGLSKPLNGEQQKNKQIRDIENNLEEKNDSDNDDEEYLVTPMGRKVKKSELPKQ
jgi:hypothetical protein